MTVSINGDTGVSAVQDNIVTADKIAAGAVTVADIADGAITSTKLASGLSLSGNVTMPDRPGFISYSTDGTDITYTTGTKINVYSNVAYNPGGHYDGTNSRFTAPITGLYFFKAQAWLPTGYTKAGLSIRVNGNQRSEHRIGMPSAASEYTTLLPSAILSLSQNDYVEIWTHQGSGTVHPSTGATFTHFSGFLIG